MKKLLVICFGWILFGCDTNEAPPKSTWTKEQIEEKRAIAKKVMEVHDTTMVLMDKIHENLNHLEELRAKADSSNFSKIDSATQLLITADDDMMNWMRNYREPSDTINYADAKKYLLRQKEKIDAVEVITYQAIDYSDFVLNNAQDTLN